MTYTLRNLPAVGTIVTVRYMNDEGGFDIITGPVDEANGSTVWLAGEPFNVQDIVR